MLALPSLNNYNIPLVDTRFERFRKGSVLSYQQPIESDCIINIYDAIQYPNLPLENVMTNNYTMALSSVQIVTFEGLKFNSSDTVKLEKQTRLQSNTP
ncbi:hypothetical protein KUTeg_017224 [Tegillarca granosa]|uniref:Uncharacterized protein n=1 Tax=Tegillarca granosa TaxID=220873 RepID=A0ABQ9ENQ0_TEGGR|nr:hypothetical protein KUTeg_017224 [Tegillarca granosa]